MCNTGFTPQVLASPETFADKRLMTLLSARIFLILAAFAALTFGTASHAHEFIVGNLTIDHPWSRTTAPAARTGVVYFNIKNSATDGDTLLKAAVASTIAKQASLHEMVMDAQGMMHMAEIKVGLPIAANAVVKFAPGGYHVMLEGLAKPLVAKQEFGLTLHFAKAGEVSVIVHVE